MEHDAENLAAIRGTVIAHGIDLIDVPRIEHMLEEHGDRFLERCFTDEERRYAEDGRGRRGERYAVRFACKEAVFKALGTGWRGAMGWDDIEVTRNADGKPSIVLHGACAERAAALSIDAWHVSLTHTAQLAMASVIACASGS